MHRLLEREDELGRLAGSVDDAGRGRGSLVLVAGEAGIGKTSLVRAVQAELGDGVAFVAGSCEALSVPVPLAPLRELVDTAGGGALGVDVIEDRVALAHSVLRSLAARAPVVAVVEDAHWADPLTLDVLRILARRIEEAGVVIVVTYRDDEVGANPGLGLLLGDLASSPTVQRIALRPLSEAAVSELAAGSDVDSTRLTYATAGNPFLVVETIAAGDQLPGSVRAAALARAGRLSPAARRVVDAAAVIGQRFEAGMLSSVIGDCSDAVEEAMARGVLVAETTSLGFRHELIREALEQSISPPRRAELHARIFSALLGHGADNARLAHHAELGGLVETRAQRCGPGAVIFAPGGAPHTFRVESDTAQMLFLSTPAGIEDYVRALGEPARWPWLQPPPDGPRVAAEKIATVERELGIVRHGPPPPAS